MVIIYAANMRLWLKKIFGAGSVRKSDIEMAAEIGYALRYEDTSEFNLTSIIAAKLSNIVCSEVSAEVLPDTDSGDMRGFLDEGFRRCFANLNLITARAFGIGGVLLKPYIYNGAFYTDIIPQNRFFILE